MIIFSTRHVELTRIHSCRHFWKKCAVEETQFFQCLLSFAKWNEIILEVAFLCLCPFISTWDTHDLSKVILIVSR